MPRSLFAAEGTMLHCSAKSKLRDILEKMSSAETSEVAPPDIPQPHKCVTIIDTMADVQSMDKPSWIMTCKDLSAHFIAFIQRKSDEYDELHIVFDRYDILKSLKSATRHLWLGDSYPVAYHSTETTNISNVPLKKLIPHSNKGYAYSIFVKRIAGVLKREQVVYCCMAK